MFYIGAPEITLISVGSAVLLLVALFLIVYFSIKGKIKTLYKKTEELSLEIHNNLVNRYELLKVLAEKKDSLKKYVDYLSKVDVPTAVSPIEDKIEFYKQIMEIDDFNNIASEAQGDIHASDDLIKESIKKYNEVVSHYNASIANWPASSMAIRYGFGKKLEFIVNNEK